MKLNRSRNAIRSSIWGLINKLVLILFPFVIRTILINKLGTEYAGLSSLFMSMLKVFNMAELGFASAVVFSMYKPIAEEDEAKICALLRFYRKLFRIVGVITVGVGLALIPFLHLFIKGDIPADINLYLLYGLYLVQTASSYLLFAYKNTLLNAHQRLDVSAKITIVLNICFYCLEIAALLITGNYYSYIIIETLALITCNLSIARRVSRLFPNYTCTGELSRAEKKDIYKNIYGLLLQRITTVTRHSINSILITSLLGLAAVAVYDNYFYVIQAIMSLQFILRNAMKGGVGNAIATESPEKNHQDMHKFMFLYAWISGCCAACMLGSYQVFMQKWVGGKEGLILNDGIMALFVAYYYLLSMGDIRFLYHQAAGLYWQKRYYTLAEAAGSILLGFLLIPRLGISGALIATGLSYFLANFLYSTRILYHYYFKNQGLSLYFKRQLFYLVINLCMCTICYVACRLLPFGGIPGFLLRLLVCGILANVILVLAYFKYPLFWEAFRFCCRATRGFLPDGIRSRLNRCIEKHTANGR